MAQPLDYHAPARVGTLPFLRPTWWDVVFAVLFLMLSAVSLWVVYRGATDEPYAGPISSTDGVVQVGLACVLVFAWVELSALSAWLAATRRASWLWLVALPWALLCCGYLISGIHGYMADLSRYHQPVWPASP